MTYDQEPPDEFDYRMIEEGDASDAAYQTFVAGFAEPLSPDDLEVTAMAWFDAWRQGAAFDHAWRTNHADGSGE